MYSFDNQERKINRHLKCKNTYNYSRKTKISTGVLSDKIIDVLFSLLAHMNFLIFPQWICILCNTQQQSLTIS